MPQDKPNTFPISLDLSDALIGYLAERPYKETSHLITSLQSAYSEHQLSIDAQKESKAK